MQRLLTLIRNRAEMSSYDKPLQSLYFLETTGHNQMWPVERLASVFYGFGGVGENSLRVRI